MRKMGVLVSAELTICQKRHIVVVISSAKRDEKGVMWNEE